MRALVVVFVAALGLLLAGPAAAHEIGLSRGLYTATEDTVELELVFARAEAAQAMPRLDADRDGLIDARELDDAGGALASDVVDQIAVEAEGERCPGELLGASLTEEDGLAVRARFRCPRPGRTTVDFALTKRLAAGHRHLARVVTADGEADHVAFLGSTTFSFGEDAPPPSRAAFVMIGVEHILLGFDHLVFLFGLILVGGRLRSLLAVVTAFTVAHSITLALAVLGILTPSPAIIEPLIALSIAYVGLENFFVKSAAGRWRITAPFGLVHGFGFAGALAEVGIPAHDVPLTLLLFNVGVELGQLLVMAAVLPILIALRRRQILDDRAVKVLSAIVIGLGLFWLVERVLGLLS
jgi:hypothetical protein